MACFSIILLRMQLLNLLNEYIKIKQLQPEFSDHGLFCVMQWIYIVTIVVSIKWSFMFLYVSNGCCNTDGIWNYICFIRILAYINFKLWVCFTNACNLVSAGRRLWASHDVWHYLCWGQGSVWSTRDHPGNHTWCVLNFITTEYPLSTSHFSRHECHVNMWYFVWHK